MNLDFFIAALLACRMPESSTFYMSLFRGSLRLFYIYLSGTHAPVEARAKVIEELVDSKVHKKQQLGLLLLEAALETSNFSSSYSFDFGARPRDFGYNPRSRKEIATWLSTFIGICTRLGLSKQSIAGQARTTLAAKLPGLWTRGGRYDAVEESARQIHSQMSWNEGWIAVRKVSRSTRKGDNDIRERLRQLEKFLRPTELLDQARIFALLGEHRSIDLEDDLDDDVDYGTALRRAEETTRQIGAKVAQDAVTLEALLPDLVSTQSGRLYSFGSGLADGCGDKSLIFDRLCVEFIKTPQERRQPNILLGFLAATADIDPFFYNSTLDSLVKDEVFGPLFPLFQADSLINQRGVERLHEALDIGLADVHSFQRIAGGRAHESISDEDLSKLVRKISSKDGGIDVALEILSMRFYGLKKGMISETLVSAAQDVVAKYEFSEGRGQSDCRHTLAEIGDVCFSGQKGEHAARSIGQRLASALADYTIYALDCHDLLCSLARTQPIVFLDLFLGGDTSDGEEYRRVFRFDLETNRNPLDLISNETLLSWCECDAITRYPVIASAIDAFDKCDKTGQLEWKPVVFSILERSPDLVSVVERLADGLVPLSWTGSRADILETQSTLLKDLQKLDPGISAQAKAQYSRLQELIRRMREWEAGSSYRERDESFE